MHLLNTPSVAKTEGLSMCWFPDSDITNDDTNTGFAARKKWLFTEATTKGVFSFRIPLKCIFGWAMDYDRVVYGYNHELVLVRQSDYYALFRKAAATEGKIELKSITLHMPVVTPATNKRIELLEIVKAKSPISMNYRERRGMCIDIPTGMQTFDWQLSTISLPKRPKYVFITFQDSKLTNQTVNYGLFKNSNVGRMSISVNNTFFRLHEEEVCDFADNDFLEFYRSFVDTRQNLFGLDNRINMSHVSPSLYKSVYTIYAFDLSKHREEIQDQTVSTTLHIYFKTALTSPLRCFVTVLCDREVVLNSDGKQVVVL